MWRLELRCSPQETDFLIADLWDLGAGGIEETGEGLRAFFEQRPDVTGLARYRPALAPELMRDWVAEAREVWQPALVGARFFLVPEWRDDPAPAGRLRIEINPGLAFGTGAHQTTRLCLEALERRVRPGMAVLDVGAGSGILAQAARLLGAGRVAACDLDPDAVQIARQSIPCFEGSIDAVRSASADLIVANISAAAIRQLAFDFRRCLGPDGRLLASGFEAGECPEVDLSLAAAGLKPAGGHGEGKWRLLEYLLHRNDLDVFSTQV